MCIWSFDNLIIVFITYVFKGFLSHDSARKVDVKACLKKKKESILSLVVSFDSCNGYIIAFWKPLNS